MKESKLGLDFKKIEYAKSIARNISNDVQTFVDSYSTVAVERTLCRLMGIDGVEALARYIQSRTGVENFYLEH